MFNRKKTSETAKWNEESRGTGKGFQGLNFNHLFLNELNETRYTNSVKSLWFLN